MLIPNVSRIGVEEVAEVVRQLATGRASWQQVDPCLQHFALYTVYPPHHHNLPQVAQKYPKFEAQENKS